MTEPLPPTTSPELLVATGVEEVKENAKNLELTWGLQPATVVSVSSTEVQATYDGDTLPIPMISIAGTVLPGDRVMAIFVPPSGNYIISVLSGGYPRLVARGERLTSSTPAVGTTGVLRVDDVVKKAGHLYVVETSTLVIFSTVANDNGSVRLAYTTDGTDAGLGSSILTLWNSSDIVSTGDGTSAMLSARVPVSTSDEILSVIMYTQRIQGTGLINIFGSSVTPIELRVIDWGIDPGDTGVDL